MGLDPRFVAVEGPIGVGKTTLAKRLAGDLGGELLLEGADGNPFLPGFYESPRAHALSTQLFFLMQRAEQLRRLSQADLFSPLRVADFMMDKDRLFAELTLNRDELSLYEQVHTHVVDHLPAPDLVIYLQAPAAVLRDRISRRGIAYEQGINREYLERLIDSYSRFFASYEAAPLLIDNTAEVDIAQGENDYRRLLDRLGCLGPGHTFFPPIAL